MPVDWRIATGVICCYGFLKEMRPSEAFLTPYLKGPLKNLTEEQVNNQVYPVWTYSYLGALPLVFLLTDLLKYKPVIVFEALTYIATWLLLLWGQGVFQMQIMQFTYGFATATEIAYYSYIYPAVSTDHYQKVTSFTRTATLSGKFIAGTLGQLLISLKVADYFALNCVSLGSVSLAFIVSLCLPSVKFGRYFRDRSQPESVNQTNEAPPTIPHHDNQINDNSSVSQNNKELSDSAQIRNQISEATPINSAITPPTDKQTPPSFNQTPPTYETDCQQELRCSNAAWENDTSSILGSISSLSPYKVTSGFYGNNDPITEESTSRSGSTEVPNDVTNGVSGRIKNSKTLKAMCSENFTLLWRDFRDCYTNMYLLKWSLWWAFATCGNFQVGNYIQNLWDVISPSRDNPGVYNGAVEAFSTLSGALIALGLGYVKFNWRIYGELLMGVISLVDAVLLIVMSQTHSIWIAYVFYVMFRASYQMVITIATFQIAGQLVTERYALVFGCNTFVALALQTTMTAILVDKGGLDSPVTTQFIVYGSYFGLLGVGFITKAAYTLFTNGCRRSWRQRFITDYNELEEERL
ncbi:unnamed protein product [Owenia fusiformis]|uniref:Uncharacterized protein n=1 Tax=Owenia fusiformis TaxID=6347 RepID=A0A8J1UGM9_OWEFU|nr:unnamed protein product [Owenia fusiformis]